MTNWGIYPKNPKLKLLITLGLIIILLDLAFNLGRASISRTALQVNNQQLPPVAKATENLNKDFMFSVKNDKGEEITKLTYTLQSADLQNDIIIKGQRASAVKGKTFLIIDIKITNPSKQTLQINSRDYIRLSVNNSKDILAPEIHNDPVQVQAISTKYTRLGFAIDDKPQKLVLHVGEISGTKSSISLKLR